MSGVVLVAWRPRDDLHERGIHAARTNLEEDVIMMTRWRTGITTAVAIALTGCAAASAQTNGSQPDPNQVPAPQAVPSKTKIDRFADRLDITGIPAGALWVTSGKTSAQPKFQSYAPGAALGIKLTDYIGVEGEAVWGIGTRQALDFKGADEGRFKTPTLFGYTVSGIVNALPSDRKIVPYGAVGLGGMFLSSREELGIGNSRNFFTGEVGGGAKVMFGKWGVRGDYRFLAVRADEHDTSFVGPNTRYAHRLYAGVVVAPGRDTSGH
jgi:hypothetical protein